MAQVLKQLIIILLIQLFILLSIVMLLITISLLVSSSVLLSLPLLLLSLVVTVVALWLQLQWLQSAGPMNHSSYTYFRTHGSFPI